MDKCNFFFFNSTTKQELGWAEKEKEEPGEIGFKIDSIPFRVHWNWSGYLWSFYKE